MHAYVAQTCLTCAEIRIKLLSKEDVLCDVLHKPHIDLRVISSSLHFKSQIDSDDHDGDTTAKEPSPPAKKKKVSIMEIKEESPSYPCTTTGQIYIFWRCVLSNLRSGTTYAATIFFSPCHEYIDATTKTVVSFTTINDSGLGQHRLRLGILADPHINNHRGAANGKRLYKSAKHLLSKYSKKLISDHHVKRIVLPGDVCDTGSEGELRAAANILKPIRKMAKEREGGGGVHCLIGNHESKPERFTKLLVPESNNELGYYSITDDDCRVHLIMLATNEQDSLNNDTEQFRWLRNDLEKASASKDVDIICFFMHYSLILHPLHNDGAWDDGLQLLDNAHYILKLIHSHPKVKMIVCGHKNVPSALVDHAGVLHTLSPQLIQVPCGYDVIDVYDNGCIRTVHEIEEMNLQAVSRVAAGAEEAKERWGEERHRSFKFMWGSMEAFDDTLTPSRS